MAIAFDTRPTAFGDLIMVTGTYAAADTTIDLSGFFSEVLAFDIMPTDTHSTTPLEMSIEGEAGPAATNVDATLADSFKLVGTTVTLYGGAASSAGAQEPGKFVSIGRRG